MQYLLIAFSDAMVIWCIYAKIPLNMALASSDANALTFFSKEVSTVVSFAVSVADKHFVKGLDEQPCSQRLKNYTGGMRENYHFAR